MTPIRLCADKGCPEPATYRGRCAYHARLNAKRTHNPQNARIYHSKRWLILRRAILFAGPLCECGQIAVDVDHITPLADGGAPYDPANLQPLCRSCHAAKTRAEQHPINQP